jgi:hypothetical protein
MATIKKTKKFGEDKFELPKGAKAVPQKDTRPKFIQKIDSTIQDRVKRTKESQEYANRKPLKEQLKHVGNELFVKPFKKNGGSIKKKMKNGGSLSALSASNKRDKGVDPKGAFTKVQKKTLAGAKGKASLTKDKQLGATKMTGKSSKMSKKK